MDLSIPDSSARLKQVSPPIKFWMSTEKPKTEREKLKTWDYNKLRSFCTANETINRVKTQPTEWEKIPQTTYLTKDLYPKNISNLKNSTNKINPSEKWANDFKDSSQKRKYKWPTNI